jgi:hypothetical protein
MRAVSATRALAQGGDGHGREQEVREDQGFG